MSTTSYVFVYYTFEGPEHEYGFEESECGSDAGSECVGCGDVESLVTGSPSPLPSPPPSALSSASSADSLSSYETCSDFEAGPLSDADATPWYLRPTPSPVFPTSPSFEWELSFYTAAGGNDSLFFDESSSNPLSDAEAATPRCADFNGVNVKTEPASPVILWDNFNFNAMERSSTDGSGTLVNDSRSPTGSREGSDSGRAPGKSSSATPEPCGWSSDEGYEADSESRLASVSLGRRATSSRKRANLKRKRGRGEYDDGLELGGAGGPRVFGHGDGDDDDDEGPAHKKRKAGPHPQSPAARKRRGGWREKMRKMKADGTFGAVMPGGTFLKMVLQTLNVNRR